MKKKIIILISFILLVIITVTTVTLIVNNIDKADKKEKKQNTNDKSFDVIALEEYQMELKNNYENITDKIKIHISTSPSDTGNKMNLEIFTTPKYEAILADYLDIWIYESTGELVQLIKLEQDVSVGDVDPEKAYVKVGLLCQYKDDYVIKVNFYKHK